MNEKIDKKNFFFVASIMNLLRSPTLIAYILKITLIFFKWLIMSCSSDKTLKNKINLLKQGGLPYALNAKI